MTSIVTDFKSSARIVNRQEQKADFEAKNPKPVPSMYAWPYGLPIDLTGIKPFVAAESDPA